MLEEFQVSYIPKTINLNITTSNFEAKAALLDRSKTYLVHCASGVRSARACDKFNQLDFPNLYNLPGGFRAWAKVGKPVEK
jgi:rhodanese-related sulfurtransferase